MTASAGYIAHIEDLLAPLEPIRIKRMFGGAGVYCGSVMFALIDRDTLYLKSDATTDSHFAAAGAEPFTYTGKDGRRMVMSYRRAPEQLFDDPEEMVRWARLALDAARRSAGGKKKKKLRQ